MNKEVRVRFAPSPTGALHIGGVRTALYNYLFARKSGGKMLLRIEDTDQTRYVPGTEEYIMEALDWLGIKMDEGIKEGGEYGPYRQSERKEHYRQYAEKLVEEGNAYYAFDTPEELDAMRERLKAARVDQPQYNAITRTTMKNSLTLSAEEVKQRIDSGEPYVIRLKVPKKEEVRLNDMVRGWVMVHSTAIDDKILMKSDGMPTYHLANVVDDHMMGITHVIRGEEWLPSAPLHVLLYRFLGWEDSMPQFAHLPLILKPDGNGKLSKRDAEKHGFPIFPLEWTEPETGEKVEGFREFGFLPEASINFLAFLGWNPGTEQEIFSMDELIEAFSIERIGKSGTKFDIDKAKWYNEQYIKTKSGEQLAGYLRESLNQEGIEASDERIIRVCEIMKERVTFPGQFWTDAKFLFVTPDSYDEKVVKKKWTDEAVLALTEYKKALADVDNLTPETAKSVLTETLEKNNIKMGRVMQAVRLAITGKGAGPDLMDIISILGKDEVILRIDNALSKLEGQVISK
ncbi:glutamate--tRNA ligase [Roseivirga sp. BDSF3-8]|uniref:glutamate--tRNA ligase n=1 Tax=Roseivirga sp. BDSF3-8 TaxID=3241598 RepID=UPI00353234D5